MCALMCAHGGRQPGAEVTGSWELPNVGIRNYTWVLCRSKALSATGLHPKSIFFLPDFKLCISGLGVCVL